MEREESNVTKMMLITVQIPSATFYLTTSAIKAANVDTHASPPKRMVA